MKSMKMRAMLALSVALSVAGFANAGVIEKVPADAVMVIKMSNLAQTSAKIGKLAGKLGITMFVPQAADPLTALKNELKITAGLDDAGEMALVMVDPKGGDPDQSTFFLVPTTNYKALVANIEGVKADGDLSTFEKKGKTFFVSNWGGYAAISENKAIVAAAPSKFLALTDRAAKEMAGNDLCVFGNVNALREGLTAELNKAHEEAKTEIPSKLKEEGKLDEKYHPAVLAAADQGFAVAEAFLRDADAATYGVTLSEAGIKSSIVAEFKPDSYLGKTVDSFQNTDATLLKNLPAGSYLLYGGFSNSPTTFTKLIEDIAGPILAKMPEGDEITTRSVEYKADLLKLLARVKTVGGGLLTPQGAIGQDALIQAVNVAEVEGDDFLKDMKSFSEKQTAIMNLAMEAGGSPAMTMTYAPGVKTIDGLNFDLMTTEFTGDSAAAAQARQQTQFMYGSEKVEQYVGQVGNKVIGFVGAGNDSVSALIAAAKAGDAPLAALETVKPITAALPKKRFAEAYYCVDEVFGTATRAAAQFGMPVNVVLPPELPPVGVTFGSSEGALEINSYVSSDLIQALISGGMQVYMQMQGGGGGGNNGGL